MRRKPWWIESLRAPEGDGAGAGGGAGGDAGGDGGGSANPFGKPAPASGDGKAGDGRAPTATPGAYYPDKLPDHLRGASDRETIDKLHQNWTDLRGELSRRGTVPAKPEDYKLNMSEELRKVYGDPSKDKGSQIFRSLAAKHKLTAEQAAGIYEDWHAELLSQGVYAPIEPMAEAKKLLGGEVVGKSDQQIMQAAAGKWKDAVDWIDGMVGQKSLTPELAMLAKGLLETADGINLIGVFRAGMREHGVQPSGQSAAGLTKQQLSDRNNDPRGNPRDPRYDAAFEQETQRLFREFYGAGTKAA